MEKAEQKYGWTLVFCGKLACTLTYLYNPVMDGPEAAHQFPYTGDDVRELNNIHQMEVQPFFSQDPFLAQKQLGDFHDLIVNKWKRTKENQQDKN